MKEQADRPGTDLARQLLRQIEERDSECAFWVVSAVRKVLTENPDESLSYFWDIVRYSIPFAVKRYRDWLDQT
jgi:hypothetical protein